METHRENPIPCNVNDSIIIKLRVSNIKCRVSINFACLEKSSCMEAVCLRAVLSCDVLQELDQKNWGSNIHFCSFLYVLKSWETVVVILATIVPLCCMILIGFYFYFTCLTFL